MTIQEALEQRRQNMQKAEEIRQTAKQSGTWGVQQNSTLAYTPPKVEVPEEQKTSADKMWDRNSQPIKIEATTRAKQKRDKAKKEYDSYINSVEYKQNQIADMISQQIARDKDESQPIASNSDLMPVAPREDERAQQLRAAMEQAEQEYNEAEDRKVIEQDLEAITGLSEDERKQLEQYFVNRDLDYYEGITAASKGDFSTPYLGRAEQEASDLIEKYGLKRVQEMANTLDRMRNAEMTESVAALGQQHANSGFFGGSAASAASVPIGVLSGPSGILDRAKELARKDDRFKTLDPNSLGNLGNVYSGAVRGQVGENIVDTLGDGFLGKAASMGYQGLMSSADSVARAYMGGGAFGGASLAATGSFSQTMADASRNGATPAQAALLATTTAGIEALTEEIPLDNLIRTAKGQGFNSAILNALRQAGIEATTEEISLIGTILAEAAILQEKSGYQRDVMTAIMNGASVDDAVLQASQNIVDEAINTALVSMISGGMSSLGGSYADARGLFAENQEQISPELNRPKNAQQEVQETPVQQEAAQPAIQQEAPQQAQQTTTQQSEQQNLTDIYTEMFTQMRENNGKASNRMAESVMSDPAAMQELGIAPEGTKAEQRRRVKEEMEKLFQKQNPQTETTRNVPEAEPMQATETSEQATMQASTPTADMQMGANDQSADGGQIKGIGAAEQSFTGKPTYNAILSEYNAQPDRRSDVRPMELPATDINGGNVSANTANVYGSQNTPDDLASAMEEPVARGDFSYVRISNDAATQRAQQTIGESGSWESARDNFRMDVDRGLAGAELSARGALILNHAAEVYEQAKASGDPQAAATAKKEWLTILSDVQKLGTNTAQGFQALRIIRDLMPQDKIQFAQIAVQNMVRDMKLGADIQINQQLLTDYENATTDQQRDEIMEKIQQNVADQIPSTILDKWNALRYTNMLGNLKTNVRNVAGNVANTAVYRFKDATGAVLESIANKVSRGKTGRTKSLVVNKQLQKAMEPYYQQVKNAVSSGGKYGENNTAAGDFAQGVMDKRQIFKFKPLESYRKATNWMMNNEYFGDEAFGKAAFTHSLAGFLQANGVTAEQFQRMMDEKPKVTSAGSRPIIPDGTKVRAADRQNYGTIQGYNPADNTYLVHFVSPSGHTANVNLSADVLTPVGKRTDALGSVPKPEQKMEFVDYAIAYAIREAQETTFHDNSALANVLGKLKKDTGIVGEGLIPFTKTPANVLTRAEEYSPIGIINTAVLSAQKMAGNTKLADANGRLGSWAAKGQDITGTDIINSLSKTLTGSAIFALGAILKSNGILNGGPDEDDDQAAFDRMNGIQPYSINLPDGTTYTLDWLTPVAMPLFMGAQLMDIASDKNLTFADLEQVFTSIADPMIQMSMMQGINSSLESIKYSDSNMGQFFINAAVNYLSQGLTNTLLGQLERSTEENRMTTYIDKDSQVPQWIQKQLGKASQKIPGWDYQQTEYIDARGEKQKNEGGLFYELLSPGYSQKVRDDAVTREMNRLRESTGENVFPDTASRTITYTDKQGTVHKDHNLTAEQYQTYAQTQGQTARQLVEELIKSRSYEAMSDEQKAEAINLAYTYARETAEKAAFPDSLGYSEKWLMETDTAKNKAGYILNKVGTAMLSGAMGKIDSAWDNNYSAENVKSLSDQLAKDFEAYSKMPRADKAVVYEGLTGTTKKYVEAREKGVSHDDFMNTAKAINNVKGTGKHDKNTGKNAVRDIDKRAAIAGVSNLTPGARDILMKAYMTDYDRTDESPTKTEPKYDFIRQEMGLSAKDYVDSYRVYLDVAGKNNEIKGIMNAINCDYATARKLRNLYGGWYKGSDWKNYIADY